MMLHVLHERVSAEGGVSTFDHGTWLDDNIVDHGHIVVGSELCLTDEFDGRISISRGAAWFLHPDPVHPGFIPRIAAKF